MAARTAPARVPQNADIAALRLELARSDELIPRDGQFGG
jgi:hypothetical protein